MPDVCAYREKTQQRRYDCSGTASKLHATGNWECTIVRRHCEASEARWPATAFDGCTPLHAALNAGAKMWHRSAMPEKFAAHTRAVSAGQQCVGETGHRDVCRSHKQVGAIAAPAGRPGLNLTGLAQSLQPVSLSVHAFCSGTDNQLTTSAVVIRCDSLQQTLACRFTLQTA